MAFIKYNILAVIDAYNTIVNNPAEIQEVVRAGTYNKLFNLYYMCNLAKDTNEFIYLDLEELVIIRDFLPVVKISS